MPLRLEGRGGFQKHVDFEVFRNPWVSLVCDHGTATAMFEFDFDQLEEEESPREKFQPGHWTKHQFPVPWTLISLSQVSHILYIIQYYPINHILIISFIIWNIPYFMFHSGGIDFRSMSLLRNRKVMNVREILPRQGEWCSLPGENNKNRNNTWWKNHHFFLGTLFSHAHHVPEIRAVERRLTWLGNLCLTHAKNGAKKP